jgi:hypothetical protein
VFPFAGYQSLPCFVPFSIENLFFVEGVIILENSAILIFLNGKNYEPFAVQGRFNLAIGR